METSLENGDCSEVSFIRKRDDCSDEVEESESKKPSRCRRFLSWDGSLLILSLCGAGVGFGVGFALYATQASSTALTWVGLPGELYMRMLKAAVLPLLVASIITGTASLKPKESGKVSGVALTYIVITNIIGAVVGTVLAVIVKPGANTGAQDTDSKTVDTGNLQTSDLFADLIRNVVPDNIVSATFEKTQTRYREVQLSANETVYDRYLSSSSGTNVLGLVVVSAALGITAAQKGKRALPFLAFFDAANEIIFRLMQGMVRLTPIGVASLIAKAIGSSRDLVAVFRGLGLFVLATTIGNFIIGIVVVALIYLVFLRKNPFLFLVSVSRATIPAFAASNSAVVMPEILNCVESRHGVDSRVSRFVVPLAIALNRDGSAMFIACTSVYMAQLHGATQTTDVVLIAVLSSVGSLAIPAVPSASIVTILMILASLEISPANIGIIIALEWFSDRMRSTANAFSHILSAILTWHFCKNSLDFESNDKADIDVISVHIPPTETKEQTINC